MAVYLRFARPEQVEVWTADDQHNLLSVAHACNSNESEIQSWLISFLGLL